MSFFQDLVNQHIKELEDFKRKIIDDLENSIRQRSYTILTKYSEQIASAQSQMTLERERLLYEALVESRKKVAETYNEVVEKVKTEIYRYIDNNRTNERYIKFIETSLVKAREIVGDNMVVYVSAKDKNAVTALMRKLNIRGEVEEKDILGGLIASSRDGSITLDMSIESLINSNIEEIKRVIYSVL